MTDITHPLIQNLEQHDRLSDEERRTLIAAFGHEKDLAAGEDLVRECDRPWESALLLGGFAARYKVQLDGKRQITAIHVPGDFVDLHSFLLKQMDHSIFALTPCKFASASHDILRQITITHPHLTRVLWMSTLIDCAINREWLAKMGGGQAYLRTAHLLCEVFVRLRPVGRTDGYSFSFPLTQAEFSDMLGLSSVHMNRVLQSLRADGLITWRGGILTINDWDRLKQAAQFDPGYLNLVVEPR